jgi:aminoglycoside phosphotransferase (APT) family kinase protein
VLGIDREGREILSFVPGESGARGRAHVVPDDGLRAYARLLRRYHDAVRTYMPPPDANWSRMTGAPGPGELVCHGDSGPWNVVWRDGDPVALVDFDHARPASPLDDVAYALEFSAPFRDDAECIRWLRFPEPPNRGHRIEVFAEAYGLTTTDGLVQRVIDLQAQDVREVSSLAREGVEPQASWVARGYDAELSARVRWSEENRHLFGPNP